MDRTILLSTGATFSSERAAAIFLRRFLFRKTKLMLWCFLSSSGLPRSRPDPGWVGAAF
jgi:hypothetical protein